MPVTTVASSLVAEAVGLLLEGLGLDDTLSGEESLALLGDLADLREAAMPADHAVAYLAALLERAQLRAHLRREIASAARDRDLLSDAPHLQAAMTVLTAEGRREEYIGGLAWVPHDVAGLTLHEFEADLRKIKKACERVEQRWRSVEPDILASALTHLDLGKEVRALRDGGWLWGLVRTNSDSARDRVRVHLSPAQRDRRAETMADILERAIIYQKEREKLDRQIAAAPSWARWAIEVKTGKVNNLRVASLRWLLTRAEAGEFGPIERELLMRHAWRLTLKQQPVRLAAKALTMCAAPVETPDLGTVVSAALHRLEAWLAEPAIATHTDFEEIVETLRQQESQLAAALTVLQSAEDCPELRSQVHAAVATRTGPFGPGDANRVRFRELLEQARCEVEDLRRMLDPIRPQYPQLATVVGELREVEGQMLADMRTQTPVRGPLRVAIAGRTKAGKTTLRKVLTRDLTEDGLGRGAHRTTRMAEDFAWDRITFVDTPGVSAKDDDYDEELAAQTCRDADAVVWVYAESLHDDEARILQSLLAVKPVLVVFNAKWSVREPRRLALFARRPGLAFRDEEGHAERSRQVAATAGVREPMFIAAHVGAARRALIAGPEADAAWQASRIPRLESELRRVLSSQAQGLRALRLADQVRTPVVVTAGRAASAEESHLGRVEIIRHRIDNEERDLQQAVERAVNRAQRRSQKNFTAVEAQLPTWTRKMSGAGAKTLQQEWAILLGKLQVDEVLAGISEDLQADAKTSGLLLDREDQLEERLQRSGLRTPARKRRSALKVAGRLIRRFIGLATRHLPRLLVKAPLGQVGWAMMAADIVATLSKAASDEVRASNIEHHVWQQNAGRAAREELERVQKRFTQELDVVRAALTTSVADHFAQARGELQTIVDNLASLSRYAGNAETVVSTIDKWTVERILDLGNVSATVVRVKRAPNLYLRVEVVGDPATTLQCLATVFDGCVSEAVTVSQPRPGVQGKLQLTNR